MNEDKIKSKLNEIEHPAIDNTLTELGIIKEIEIEDEVKITVAFPFAEIPIKKQLLNSIKEVLEDFGVDYDIEQTVMDEEEREEFMEKEKANWKE